MQSSLTSFNYTDYIQDAKVAQSLDQRVSVSEQKIRIPQTNNSYKFDPHRRAQTSFQTSSPITRRGMQLTISGNAFTRKASQLQPDNKLVYGWNAGFAVHENAKLPRAFKNFDKATLRELDK